MDLADDWLYQKYDAICSQSDTVFQGVLSSMQSAIQFFDLDDGIRQLVSHDDLGDFDSLRQERTSLYLVSSTTKGEYYGPLMSILLDQYFETFFSRIPQKDEQEVFFHLDECPVLRLDNLDLICANVRKHFGSICLVAQDPHAQLEAIYGSSKKDAILSNLKTKAYFSINADNAKRLEKQLGVFEYEDDYDNGRVKTRSLKTASELMLLGENKVLITQSGEKPVLSTFKPYFKQSKYLKQSQLSPYELHLQKHGRLELIPLKDLYSKTLRYAV